MVINHTNYRKRKSTRFTHRKKQSSKYIGVLYNPSRKKYSATIRVKGNPIVKYYRSELAAAKGYDKLKLLYEPNSKCINFPPVEEEKNTSIFNEDMFSKKKRKRRSLTQVVARRGIKKCELWFILQSQNYCCNLCDKLIKGCVPIIDHIIPLSCGGTYVMNNLQALCSMCNSWKSGVFDHRIRSMLTDKDLTSHDILNIMKSVFNKKHAKSKNKNEIIVHVTNNDSSTCNLNF